MKIILHGATDCDSSNYGDFLYGKLIYDHLREKYPEASVSFYNPSNYFKTYIDNSRHNSLRGKLSSSDLAIYIPGGYFGEGHNASWKETLVQIIRFIPFGIKAIILKKPLAIIGVGVGPCCNLFFRTAIKIIVNKAATVCVRDKESFFALEKNGCKRASCCSDPILAFEIKNYEHFMPFHCDDYFIKICNMSRKAILVHFNHSIIAASKFGESIKLFLESNPEYYPVVSADQRLKNECETITAFEKAFDSKQYVHYTYENPFEFGSLISKVELVLTCKLHVGVTAAIKGKALLAVAVHPEKTERFYKQIGAEDHYMNLFECSPKEIAERLSNIKEKNIKINKDIFYSAKKNIEELDSFIENNR